jgi:hypothetical protein
LYLHKVPILLYYVNAENALPRLYVVPNFVRRVSMALQL